MKALLVEENQQATFKDLNHDDLPDGDVLVKVAYSSLNYKDGLAVTGKGKVIRKFPMVPGIDLAGTVEESSSPDYKPGDPVVLTGWGIGESHWGGYAEMARVKSEWLVSLPDGLTLQQAMGIGTAGFTAMMSVEALEAHGITPEMGEVVVTGASGGVGSIAIAILGKLGYTVVASTGRTEQADYLKSLGATTVVHRDEFSSPPERPMGKGRWAGAVDSVGGDTLANILSSVTTHGSVASVGLAGGTKLNTTVLPFILRGVSLVGIDSVTAPKAGRMVTWQRLATDLPSDMLDQITQVAPLNDVPQLAEQILAGQVRGRTVIQVS